MCRITDNTEEYHSHQKIKGVLCECELKDSSKTSLQQPHLTSSTLIGK